MNNLSEVDKLLADIGIDPKTVIKTASAKNVAPAQPTGNDYDPMADHLRKQANFDGGMGGGEEENLEAIIQELEGLKQRKERGEMLSPEEENLYTMGVEAGIIEKFASVKENNGGTEMNYDLKKIAAGIEDANKQISRQTGVMAEELKSKEQRKNPTPGQYTGDDGVGEQNPTANGAKIPELDGPAQKTHATSNINNPKTAAINKIAAKIQYKNEVEKYASLIVERIVNETQAAEQAAYNEKIAQVNEVMQFADIEGTKMAEAFYSRLQQLTGENR